MEKRRIQNAKLLFNSVFCCKDDDDDFEDEDEEDHRWVSARFVVAVFLFRKEFCLRRTHFRSRLRLRIRIESSSKAEKILRDLAQKISESDRLYYEEAKENTHGRRVRLVTDEI